MININGLNFVYSRSKKHAVKNVDFGISKGEVFGFLGPSGAGKTTTQRLIIGLLSGYSGEISVMGKERSEWGTSFFEHIGVAFDFPNLYLKLTGEENLRLISAYYEKEPKNIHEYLDRVGLLKDKDTKVENYSKGMKMQLNFIRSILHDPDIVFFDEPTSGLDPVNAKIIKDMILQMKGENKAIFLTTHNMTVAEQICDRVAFINEGQISAIDNPQKLMREFGKEYVDISYEDNGTAKSVSFPLGGIGDNDDFCSIIKSRKILSMHTQESSLEDVFIKFTGRGLA